MASQSQIVQVYIERESTMGGSDSQPSQSKGIECHIGGHLHHHSTLADADNCSHKRWDYKMLREERHMDENKTKRMQITHDGYEMLLDKGYDLRNHDLGQLMLKNS